MKSILNDLIYKLPEIDSVVDRHNVRVGYKLRWPLGEIYTVVAITENYLMLSNEKGFAHCSKDVRNMVKFVGEEYVSKELAARTIEYIRIHHSSEIST
jgi:hypothetical protein